MPRFTPFNGLDSIEYTDSSKFNLSNELSKHKSYLDNVTYEVIWYQEITRDNRNNNNLNVKVVVSNIDDDKNKIYIVVPVDVIPKIPLGSLLRSGRLVSKIEIPEYALFIEPLKEDSRENFTLIRNADRPDTKAFYTKNYNVPDIFDEEHTLLKIFHDHTTYIIHPLTFYFAHYGTSSRIKNLLLSETYQNISDELWLDYENINCEQAIFIPNNYNLSDAPLMYHLKNREYTQQVVMELRNSINRQFIEYAKFYPNNPKPRASLRVEPFHEQGVEMTIRGLPIDENTVLCMEITGISMPLGDPIYFDVDGYTQGGDNDNKPLFYRPLFNKIDSKEVILDADIRPNNTTTAVLIQKLKTIGEIRDVIFNDVSPNEAWQQGGKRTALLEDRPLTFGIGDAVGAGGTNGMVEVLSGADVIKRVDESFLRLWKYAQDYIQGKANSSVECYLSGNYLGNPVAMSQQGNFPFRMLVLKLVVEGQIYFIFDCESTKKRLLSGIVKRVDDGYKPDRDYNYLFKNKGRLSGYEMKSKDVQTYKHMNADGSNWVKTVLDKFD